MVTILLSQEIQLWNHNQINQWILVQIKMLKNLLVSPTMMLKLYKIILHLAMTRATLSAILRWMEFPSFIKVQLLCSMVTIPFCRKRPLMRKGDTTKFLISKITLIFSNQEILVTSSSRMMHRNISKVWAPVISSRITLMSIVKQLLSLKLLEILIKKSLNHSTWRWFWISNHRVIVVSMRTLMFVLHRHLSG